MQYKGKMMPFTNLLANKSAQCENRNNGIKDTPILDVKDDKLEFGELATHLANVFTENDLSRGLVIGVEGAWGSGKTSLVNLALNKLKHKQIVRFSPWLIGNREDLLYQFFVDLGDAIHELLPRKFKRKTYKMMKLYAALALDAAKISEPQLGSTIAFIANLLGKFLKRGGEQASRHSAHSLSKLRSQLQENLALLEGPIVVFVDDLDRLEPREVFEVIRLVRAVADFPNVGYILAYDPEILSASLKNAVNIEEKHAYLEKIIQASFRVPNAQRANLKNWLFSEFVALLEDKSLGANTEKEVFEVLDKWGDRYLETPRDVIRTVNSLKLNFVPVRKQVYSADALFLQLTQVKDKRLFQWIQRYVVLLSGITEEYKIHEVTRIRMGDELLKLSGETNYTAQTEFLNNLSEHLPGLVLSRTDKGAEFVVFSNLDESDLQQHSDDRRLASANYYSLYFSFNQTA